jgi:predicted RNA-binding protein with RPS1 domain
MVIELQDHLAQAEEVDIKFLTGQLLKLRMSISMREDSRRKTADLERKQRETEAKLELAEKREALFTEQIAKLERERAKAEAKDKAALAILDDASLPFEQRVGKMRNLFSIGG